KIRRCSIGQIPPAVAFFQEMFESVGSKERAIAGIFDAIEVNVERDDIPLVGLVFANVDVIAHYGAEFNGAAEPKVYRGFRASAGLVMRSKCSSRDSLRMTPTSAEARGTATSSSRKAHGSANTSLSDSQQLVDTAPRSRLNAVVARNPDMEI